MQFFDSNPYIDCKPAEETCFMSNAIEVSLPPKRI